MKLYNLLEEVILDEINKNRRLLSEGVSIDLVKDAIDGKYNVNILYRDYEDQPPSKRYIQVYNLSKTKAGNDAIRAYQIFGGSKKGNKNGFWKIFRLDRIEGWYPTKVKWTEPVSNLNPEIPKYNATGDRSMSAVNYKVNVNQNQTTNKL
jgi:predicted DNA-binding transcriptional regulator YafY